MTDKPGHQDPPTPVSLGVLAYLEGDHLDRLPLLPEEIEDLSELAGELIAYEDETEPAVTQVGAHPGPEALDICVVTEKRGESCLGILAPGSPLGLKGPADRISIQ